MFLFLVLLFLSSYFRNDSECVVQFTCSVEKYFFLNPDPEFVNCPKHGDAYFGECGGLVWLPEKRTGAGHRGLSVRRLSHVDRLSRGAPLGLRVHFPNRGRGIDGRASSSWAEPGRNGCAPLLPPVVQLLGCPGRSIQHTRAHRGAITLRAVAPPTTTAVTFKYALPFPGAEAVEARSLSLRTAVIKPRGATF